MKWMVKELTLTIWNMGLVIYFEISPKRFD